MHWGFSDLDDGGISPQASAVHGAMKLRPVRIVSASSPVFVSGFPSPPFGDGGGALDVLEHAMRKRTPKKEE